MLRKLSRERLRRLALDDYLIALGLSLGAVVALGFTRFAYALLLPAMREDLHWAYAASGGLGTANAIGYIAGASTATLWATRLGPRRAFVFSIALSALGLIVTAATASYTGLAAIRVVSGYTTAVTFVVGSVLATRIRTQATHKVSALLVAVYMSGVGVGIVISGLVVPGVFALSQPDSWRAGWVVMGTLAALAVFPAWRAAELVPDHPGKSHSALAASSLRAMWATVVWYILFGAGYVSYMTFVIALLRDDGMSSGTIALFFVVLGVSSAAATLSLWGHVLGHLHGGRAPALVSLVVAVGVLPILVLPTGVPTALSSAVVFGGSFMAGPTAATILARRALPAQSWTAGIAVLTVAFSIGQAAGPVLAGVLADSPGGISRGLWLSAGLLFAAAVVVLAQRAIEHKPS